MRVVCYAASLTKSGKFTSGNVTERCRAFLCIAGRLGGFCNVRGPVIVSILGSVAVILSV